MSCCSFLFLFQADVGDEELGVCHAAVFLFLFPADVGDEELGVCHAAVFCFYFQLMLVMRS